jgi:hypothetical protein
MNKEVYPVEASREWKWIASPNHDKKMRYYDFQDLLKNGPMSKAVYEDANLNQFYHSSAELPGHTADKIHFRTSIWSQLKYRDYTAYFNGSFIPTRVEKSKIKSLCPNLKNEGFSEPILSKDGTEIAGVTKDKDDNQTTKVFKIEKNGCTLAYDVGYTTSKVSFSYPKPGQMPMLTFTATMADKRKTSSPSKLLRSGVWVYDPNKNETFPISPLDEGITVSYPGFTEDGRIFYVRAQNSDFGVVIADATKLMSPACQ